MTNGPDFEGELPIAEMDFNGLRAVSQSLLPEHYHDRLDSLRNIAHQLANLKHRLDKDGVPADDTRIQTIDQIASRIGELDPEILLSREGEKAYIKELKGEPDEGEDSAFALFRKEQQTGEIPEQ